MGQARNEWLERTGGFRLFETGQEFLKRTKEIQKLEEKIGSSKSPHQDIERIQFLKGLTDENGNFIESYDWPEED